VIFAPLVIYVTGALAPLCGIVGQDGILRADWQSAPVLERRRMQY
jgi:hypothetical protein